MIQLLISFGLFIMFVLGFLYLELKIKRLKNKLEGKK